MSSKSVSAALAFFMVAGMMALPAGAIAEDGTKQAMSAEWTLIVYMSGDSSLEDNVAEDLREMQRVGSGEGLEIVALADKGGDGDTTVHHVLAGSPDILPPSVINASWGDELNLGTPEVLVEFVLWAAERYPAEKYILDLWGHGKGWTGVCPDKGDYIEAAELKSALVSLNSKGFHPDIVSMDACQMGMLETLYQMRGMTDFGLVSEKDVPAAGWPYDRFLEIVKNNSGLTPRELGPLLVEDYIAWGIPNTGYSLTLSFIDINKLDGVAAALDGLAEELYSDALYFHTEIEAARKLTERYDGNNQFDLGHLAANIANTTGAGVFSALAAGLSEAIEDAVVHERHWERVGDEPANNATGMSIWFPLSAPYDKYVQLDICRDTGWDEFLGVFASAVGTGARNESALITGIISRDMNGDGLNDTVNIAAYSSPDLEIKVDFLDSDGKQVYSVSGSGSIDNETWTPPGPGIFSASVYLRDGGGWLKNFTGIVEGINAEALYLISGRVLSNTGKALSWVKITVSDGDTNFSADVYSDFKGRFEISMKAPWDTDGSGVSLICHHGIYTQNLTLDSLVGVNAVDFEIPAGPYLTLPLMYLSLCFNFLSMALVAAYIFGLRRTQKIS